MSGAFLFRTSAASIAVAALLCCEAHSQAPPAPITEPPEDQSFYLGKPVVHPEGLSGVWEAPNGHGGAIGLHLILLATAPADATTLVGAKQSWLHLEVALYERAGATLQIEEQNYFDDSPKGGYARYDDGRLTLHNDKGFDLDLQHLEGDK